MWAHDHECAYQKRYSYENGPSMGVPQLALGGSCLNKSKIKIILATAFILFLLQR